MIEALRSAKLVLALACIPALVSAQGYGSTVTAGPGEMFIGDPVNPYAPGTVHVYRPDAQGRWVEVIGLRAPDGFNFDRFGRSISAVGNRLLVGSTSIDDAAGAAYIFEKDRSGNWQHGAKLVAKATRPGDSHGRIVLLGNDMAYVASWGANEGRGAVTVWRLSAQGTWVEEATLQAGDGLPGDFFGTSLSADGDRLLVGAAARDTATGVAYVFRRDPAIGTWSQESRLRGRGLSRGSSFGMSASLRGDEAYVGALGHERGAGAVFVFTRNPANGSWMETLQLRAFDAAPGAQYGGSMAWDGNDLWIGAPGAQGGAGRIYRLIRNRDGEITGVSKLQHPAASAGEGFGGTLSILGNTALVGLPGDGNIVLGAASVLSRRSGQDWSIGDKMWTDTGTLESVIGEKMECDNGTAGGFECNGTDLLSYLPVSAIGGQRGTKVNDVWGWTDPTTGKEYALVGRTDGTAFVDVSDPSHPIYLGELPKTEGSRSNWWRDIKVYQDHAFIVADGALAHGMQVFDLTRLRSVPRPPAKFTEDAHYDKIFSAHNIVIDTSTGFAFAVGSNGGGESCGGALHMIDIREPKNPRFAGCYADPATGYSRTGYTHDAQCVTYHGPDAAYQGRAICLNSSETALGIADVTDKANPKVIASLSYPNVSYAHQGWLSEDQRYFFMNDEGDEGTGQVAGTRTLVVDVSDLDDPVLAAEYIAKTKSTDHNLYVNGNLMYESNYVSGLRILDISDPLHPVEVGYFDTTPFPFDEAGTDYGSWSNYPYFKSGTIVVTSQAEGLFMLKKSDRTLVP